MEAAHRTISGGLPAPLGFTAFALIISDGHIKGGTLLALVHALFDAPPEVDRTLYESSFRLTYASFTNPSELIHLLTSYYVLSEEHATEAVAAKVLRLRICNFFRNWLQVSYRDLRPVDVEEVQRFALGLVAQTDGENVQKIILDTLRKAGQLNNPQYGDLQFAREPPAPFQPPSGGFSFLDLNPVEVARQLTLIHHRAYRPISPLECLDKAWMHAEKEVRAPTITKLIRLFNLHAEWVTTLVVSQEELGARVSCIEQLISAGQHLRMLKNFFGLYAVISGLGSVAVRRLQKTWDKVSRSKLQLLSNFTELMNPARNFGNYRTALKDSVSHAGTSGIMPFIGTFLTDLVYIDDGNPDFLKDDPTYINFTKRHLCATVIHKIMQYTCEPYNLKDVPSIQNFLENLTVWTEDERQAASPVSYTHLTLPTN